VQGTTLPAVVRWARLPEDTARAEELRLARMRATEAALDDLPRVADELGIDGDVVARLREEYEQHALALEVEPSQDGEDDGADARDLDRRLRLALLGSKRRAVISLRDSREIDDIVLREVQAVLDLEELRLLGPASAE
jgi:monovalent cation/hydrogen antiporter